MAEQDTTPQAPVEYSLSDLDSAVAEGRITQTQRDQIWTNQVSRHAQTIARTEAREVVAEETRNERIDTELQQYVSLHPELDKDDSSLRQRVQQEFDYLVSRGAKPKDLSTELAAVRAVLGPIERARALKQGRRVEPQPWGDTQTTRLSPQQRREEDAWSKIPAANRAHYDGLISKGVYRDRAAAIAEFNWRRPDPGRRQQPRGTA